MSDLYENINENVSTIAAAGLFFILLLNEKACNNAFNNYAKQKYGDELILMSDLTCKRIGSSVNGLLKKDWTMNHPTELVDFLQKYDNELYNKYKDKNIIYVDQYSLKNDKSGNIFFANITVFNPFNDRRSLFVDEGIEPMEYKYIPINSISKKYSAYYIIGSIRGVDRDFKDTLNKIKNTKRFHNSGLTETDYKNLVESKYPQVKELKSDFLKNNKSKKTDDKSTTNTKDENKTPKETNVNESTLPSKERNKLDDDEDKKEFIYDLRGECITESCKDVETARKFLQEVDDLSKKYDANFFIVTDGASMTRNGRGKSEPAVKNARDNQIKWEKKNGGNPDEDWLKHINESTLPSKERSKLDDDAFGIPSLRKYPLNDKAHVLAAIRMFNRVDRKHEKELAYNIIAAMEKYKISKDIIGLKNRLQSYI